MMAKFELAFVFTVSMFAFTEVLQALDGSRAAFTACENRKGHLSAVRTIHVATEQTFHSE